MCSIRSAPRTTRGVLPSWAGGYQNEDMPTNIYSPAYNASRLSSGIRQSVMQDMNPTGQFLYQAGTSALDSAVNMAVSTGLVGTVGGAAGAGAKDAIAETMNWVMGSQVAADSVYEGIQNGKSNADALVDGIVEGAIEGFTEKYSVGHIIENMLSGKAVWEKALRSFASEGAEEIASNWLNRAYDVALAAMVGDFAKEDSLSFLAGGLSGLAMSGTYAGVNRVILEANVTQTARAVIEAGEVQDVIDYGMAQEEGTKAHQLAEELQQTVNDGGEVTQKAVENTLREVAKEQQAAVDEGTGPAGAGAGRGGREDISDLQERCGDGTGKPEACTAISAGAGTEPRTTVCTGRSAGPAGGTAAVRPGQLICANSGDGEHGRAGSSAVRAAADGGRGAGAR